MKFGIHSPSWLYPGNLFDGIAAKAQWLGAHDFTWLSVMDHVIQIPVHGPPTEPFMEAWTTLAALAAVTTKIRLGSLVTSTSYRNPALLAKMVAGVDHISRGRVTLGIGAGWFENEYRQYGFEFQPAPAERIYRLEEAVRLIRTLWTEPRATFAGRYFRVDDAILEPKPVQKPHPPILIGGAGEQLTLRTVARVGNACNFFGGPDVVHHKFEVLRQHCDRENRDFAEIERTVLCNVLIAEDEAALQAKMEHLEAAAHFTGRPLTRAQAAALFADYADAGVQMLICSVYRNDFETLSIIAELKAGIGD